MVIKHPTQIGNPVIRSKARPVRPVQSVRTKRIVRNLIDSMRYHGLVGMAAPQIGIGLRVFVTETRKTTTRTPKQLDPVRVFINPNIVNPSKKQVLGAEGCGSVARGGLFAKVKRPERVIVKAFDRKGRKFTVAARGLLARIIQHETDHLDGTVFLDRLPHMKGLMSREEYMKRRR
jgi:peptide deformylase